VPKSPRPWPLNPRLPQVQNVDTKSLKHLQPFRQGSWVVSDCWLGRVVSYRDDVVVNFDDGSQCLVTTTTNGELVAAQKMYERSPLFPSMLVKAGQYYSFKEAQWIKGSYNKQKQGKHRSITGSRV